MFSGIIEAVGRVRQAEHSGTSLVLVLETGFAGLELGESIAVNGVCLTVTEFDAAGTASFYASRETIERSNLGALAVGGAANLERAVRLETRLSGHLVQGHVDGKAVLATVTPEDGAYRIALSLPANLARYCVEKGSICLNGISLTLNGVSEQADGRFTIAITIIPHTWDHTNLHAVAIGDDLNVEVDVIAKYVERLCQPYHKP